MADTITFTIGEDVQHVVIGPVESAFQACKDEENGLNSPVCWHSPPSTHCGGTVLVHDVNMRVPVLTGEWNAGKLFNFTDNMCGGMIWHSSVGTEENAAKLLYDMENAGAPVICNMENDDIIAMGIRFIGRYSWCEPRGESSDTSIVQLCEDGWGLFNGPVCVFSTPDTFRATLLPDVLSRLQTMQQRVHDETEQRLAAGQTEHYHEQFKVEAMTGNSNADLAYPPVTVFNNAGVMYTFRQHEYMFGRLWFTADMKCKAFCFYTYAAPEYFGQMRLGVTPICSKLPKLAPDQSLWREYYKILASTMMELSDEFLSEVFADMTSPFRAAILSSCRRSSPSFLCRLFTNKLVAITADLFRQMIGKFSYREKIDDELVLTVLANTSDEVLHNIISNDVNVYHLISNGLADGSYSLTSPSMENAQNERPSILGCYLEKPAIVTAMLERGFSPNEMLSEAASQWFRNVLCEAASQGLVDTVKLLLDAGADVNSVVCGDHWPTAIVYAADSGSEECLALMRERFPDHEIWSRNDIPLESKKLPRKIYAGLPPKEEKGPELPVATGSLADVLATAQQRKVAATVPAAGFGVFNVSGIKHVAKACKLK